jgi:hypothetical protein
MLYSGAKGTMTPNNSFKPTGLFLMSSSPIAYSRRCMSCFVIAVEQWPNRPLRELITCQLNIGQGDEKVSWRSRFIQRIVKL